MQIISIGILYSQISKYTTKIQFIMDTSKVQQALSNDGNQLYLSRKAIGAEDCKEVAHSQWSDNLRTIYIDNNSFGDQGCEQLGKSKFPNLTKFYLNSNKIKMISPICQIPLQNICFLSFCNNQIMTIEPITRLDAPSLQSIYLNNNNITIMTPINKLKSRNIKQLWLAKNQLKQLNGFEGIFLKELATISLYNMWNQPQNNISIRPIIKSEMKTERIKVWLTGKHEKLAKECLEKKYSRSIFN